MCPCPRPLGDDAPDAARVSSQDVPDRAVCAADTRACAHELHADDAWNDAPLCRWRRRRWRRWWRRRRRGRWWRWRWRWRWRRRRRRRRWRCRWWRWRRRRRGRPAVVAIRMLGIASELPPLDAAVVRAVQVVGPDLVVVALDPVPAVRHHDELVPPIEVDVRDR